MALTEAAEGGAASVVSQEALVGACGEAARYLKGYQLVGVNFLTLLARSGVGGAIVADEMGLGKTAQAIAFLGAASTLSCVAHQRQINGSAPNPDMQGIHHRHGNRHDTQSVSRSSMRDFLQELQHEGSLECSIMHAPVRAGVRRALDGDAGPHIIVAPASLLQNWQRELARWCPGLKAVLYYGKDRGALRERLSAWRCGACAAVWGSVEALQWQAAQEAG